MTWLQTHTGRAFSFEDLLEGRSVAIEARDLAVSLSRVNRFLGHTTSQTWSVGQHSLAMSFYVPPELALAALLHDAAEAYVGDLPAPLRWLMRDMAKRDGSRAHYEVVEGYVSRAVEHWAGLSAGACRAPDIKHADLRMLATERERFMAPAPMPWVWLPEPFPTGGEHALLWANITPDSVARRFLRRLEEVSGGRLC